jgi:phage-related baseplate assembly protein
MDATQVHYLTYDPDEIWLDMVATYVEAGGDILYPGDEKEMLLRGVLAIITQVFAGVDNALRMDTLRYAVRDYLDLYGEKRNCARIQAQAAQGEVEITFRATGQAKVLPVGTALTADGERYYALTDPVEHTGLAHTAIAQVTCTKEGGAGNGLLAGTQMQFAIPEPAAVSVYAHTDASGGRDKEDDESYRERIRTYGLINITTGPEVQYRSAAMSVTSEIVDAKAVNAGAGKVGVYLILKSSEGAEAILASVLAALNAQNVRPLTDQVTVYEAEAMTYTLNVQYEADSGTDTAAAIAAAAAAYQDWQDNNIGRHFNPDRLMAGLYQAGATRVIWGAGSAFDGGAVEYTEIAAHKRCKGTITLEAI